MSRPGKEVHAEILEIAYPSESSVYSVNHTIIDYPMVPLLVRSLKVQSRRAAWDTVCFIRKRSSNLSALTITQSLSQQSLFSFNRLQELGKLACSDSKRSGMLVATSADLLRGQHKFPF
jgi:hypothetical protein